MLEQISSVLICVNVGSYVAMHIKFYMGKTETIMHQNIYFCKLISAATSFLSRHHQLLNFGSQSIHKLAFFLHPYEMPIANSLGIIIVDVIILVVVNCKIVWSSKHQNNKWKCLRFIWKQEELKWKKVLQAIYSRCYMQPSVRERFWSWHSRVLSQEHAPKKMEKIANKLKD